MGSECSPLGGLNQRCVLRISELQDHLLRTVNEGPTLIVDTLHVS